MKLVYIWCLVLVLSPAVAQQRQAVLWRTPTINPSLPPTLRAARPVLADVAQLQAVLAAAPTEDRAAAGPLLPVPQPDGTTEYFRVWQTPVLAPALAARYPDIRTYAGQSVSNPSVTARFDLTPQGFHAQVIGAAQGRYFVDPVPGTPNAYRSFAAADRLMPAPWGCQTVAPPASPAPTAARTTAVAYGSQLRTYRLALGCTGEYAAAVTSAAGVALTKGNVLAAMTTAVNRITGVYEQELAIRLQLIAGNDAVIFLDGATDPYTNNNINTMYNENRTVMSNAFDPDAYDIGHAFGTTGGGLADVGIVCLNTGGGGVPRHNKARGVTGIASPVGDAFYVDYVAHEMGHQFGANHTFDGVTDACASARNAATAVEPGSGSTIMGYAGICGADNLQVHSDAFFHGISQDEIRTYLTTGGCGASTATGNTAPTANAGPDYSIPQGTPFMLTGSGTDADAGTTLTYSWEQMDVGGNGGAPTAAATSPSAPQFRSFAPSLSASRTFPRLTNLLNNEASFGEVLPLTPRILTFRLTVRDNRPGGGGVASDDMVITVSELGPLAVSSHNTATTFAPAATTTVTWAVNNIDLPPISATAVDILFAADGRTYDRTLVSNTPNDGTQLVQLPNIQTTTGRIMVRARGNIFFDVNNANITLAGPLPVSLTAFDARRKGDNSILLTWTTAQERNNRGFEVLAQGPDDPTWRKVAWVTGAGQSDAPRHYAQQLDDLTPGRWHLRLEQVDFDDTRTASEIREVDLSVQVAAASCYPNPAAELATAALVLPQAATATLRLRDVLGRTALILPARALPAGWHQLPLDLRPLAPGLYTWQLQLSTGQVLRGRLQVAR